jgi:hypothetical protein
MLVIDLDGQAGGGAARERRCPLRAVVVMGG